MKAFEFVGALEVKRKRGGATARRNSMGFAVAGMVCVCLQALPCVAQQSNEIAWALKSEPKTLDPALTDDQASLTVRYLTAGVLLRLNRQTLQVEPSLAERFELTPDGRLLTLHLRKGLQFSDGSALTSADAVWSLQRVMTPSVGAPVAEEFGAGVTVDAPDATHCACAFAAACGDNCQRAG